MTNEQLEQWIDDLQSGMYINCVYCGHRYGPNSGPSTKKFNITMRKALEEHISSCPKHPLSAAKDEIATLKEQVKELEVTLDLIHDADMRAIKMWQEAHPDKENMWPDQAMMVCWLMERVKDLESERKSQRRRHGVRWTAGLDACGRPEKRAKNDSCTVR